MTPKQPTKPAAKASHGATKKGSRAALSTPDASRAGTPRLLTGGNPQIAKGDGDAPVQAYIAALPGWKNDAVRKMDQLIERNVSGVRKAVRWNSPFYGIEGQGWFLGVHVMTKYVKVAFFAGTSLKPVPPVSSKQKDVRYLHISEGEALDIRQLSDWLRQAARLPGMTLF